MKTQELAGDHTILISQEAVFAGPGGQLWECVIRRCLLLLACIFLAVFAGCIVIPIPTPEHGLLEGRGEIAESDISFLKEGETTREEVVLRFGEPDLVLHDQRILVYHWEVVHGYVYVAVGGPGGAAGDEEPIPKTYLIMLEFDEKGRLKRFERSGSIWRGAETRINEWITDGGIIRIAPIH